MKNHHIRSKLRRFLCLAAALLMLWPQTVTAGGHITAAEKAIPSRRAVCSKYHWRRSLPTGKDTR